MTVVLAGISEDAGARYESAEPTATAADIGEETVNEEQQTAEELYVLKNRGGTAAVFSGSGELLLETDISVAGLRETDRKMLENGIEVNSYESVLKLLEDLSS